MIEPDTVKLLRECDAGIKMGVGSISDVLDRVESPRLKTLLEEGKGRHEALDRQLQQLLHRCGDRGKDPNFLAEGMSKMKTGVLLQLHGDDATVADLMTDGCNMGVKSLSKYLNQYAAADEASKDITKKLIALESQMSVDLRQFL